MRIPDMLRESRWCRIYNYPTRWYNLGLEDFLRRYDLNEDALYSHLEPRRR